MHISIETLRRCSELPGHKNRVSHVCLSFEVPAVAVLVLGKPEGHVPFVRYSKTHSCGLQTCQNHTSLVKVSVGNRCVANVQSSGQASSATPLREFNSKGNPQNGWFQPLASLFYSKKGPPQNAATQKANLQMSGSGERFSFWGPALGCFKETDHDPRFETYRL